MEESHLTSCSGLGSGGSDLSVAGTSLELVAIGSSGIRLSMYGAQIGLGCGDLLLASTLLQLLELCLGHSQGSPGLLCLQLQLGDVQPRQQIASLDKITHLHQHF